MEKIHFLRLLLQTCWFIDLEEILKVFLQESIVLLMKSILQQEETPSDQLRRLREQLLTLELDGFLVPSTDAHQSEYVAEHDKRRAWLSGFTGSNGFAVVTSTSAALWTDGRYYLQAEDQLDCNWILMRADEPDTPDWWDWLEEDSKSDVLEKEFQLGADPALTAADDWLQWKENLSKKNIVLKSIIDNPIDKIWVEKGKRPPSEVAVHQLR